MSVDILQEKIRKTKNPSVLLIEAIPSWLPSHLRQEEAMPQAFARFVRELLDGLKGFIPAVRFGFGSFSLLGADGVDVLHQSAKYAKDLGFYVLLDLPEMLTPESTKNAASVAAALPCDGVVAGMYLGSDILTALRPLCEKGKTVFAICRTSNKSAGDLQDLLTGGRLVHTAAADLISRYGEPLIGKCGYSHMGLVAAAASAQSLQTLRGKFSRIFMLLDGYDYPNANAKNCSFAFDRFGHGAAAVAGASVAAAWKEGETDGGDYVALAVQAAERMKKNLTRYVTVL